MERVAIFGPAPNIPEASREIMELLTNSTLTKQEFPVYQVNTYCERPDEKSGLFFAGGLTIR